jgi:hypothetical protein
MRWEEVIPGTLQAEIVSEMGKEVRRILEIVMRFLGGR